MPKGTVPGCARQLVIAFVRRWTHEYSAQSTPFQEQITLTGLSGHPFTSAAKKPKHWGTDFPLTGTTPLVARKKDENGFWREALQNLDVPGFQLDIASYTSLLQFCADTEALADGKLIHKHLIQRELHEHQRLGSLLLHLYSTCGAIQQAKDVFSSLLHRDDFAFSSMAKLYCRQGHSTKVSQLLEQMRNEGILPNKQMFNSVLCACSSQGALAEGRQVHAQITGTTFTSEVAIETSLINMYSKCRQFEFARWIFERMAERDTPAWNAIIAACLLNSHGKDALQFFHHMQQQGVTASKVTCIHILDACASQMALKEGKYMHSRITFCRLESNVMLATALIDMYGKCGRLDYIFHIFDSALVRDEVIWSVVISAYAQSGNTSDVFQAFNQMQLEAMLPDRYVYSNILSGCTNHFLLKEGKEIHARLSSGEPESETVVGSTLVNFYGKLGCLVYAQDTFDRMHERDLIAWNALIAGYAESDQNNSALQVYNQMHQEGILADSVTFISILSVCASEAASREGKRVHVHITMRDLESDLNVGNALANMYGKSGSLDDMLLLFREMPERNLISWNTVIGACAQHGKGKQAFEIFEKMQKAMVVPDKTTLIGALSACANQGSLAEGHLLHKYLTLCGIQLDLYIRSALVNLYGKCGSLNEARRMFDAVPDCERDVGTWNAMIGGYAENGKGEEALQLFDEMLQQRLTPTSVTFVSVLFACSHVGLVDEACHHFNSMKDYAISPAVEHYNCMIDLLGRVGRLDEAEGMLRSMSMQPTEASLMSLLGACRNQCDVKRGERIAEKMVQLDPKIASPYVILSNIYASVGRIDDANKLMNMRKVNCLLDVEMMDNHLYEEDEVYIA